MQILLAEDTDDLGRLVQLTLGRDGHDVRWVRDGAAFREALADRTPDLVVMDIGLPDVSGIVLLRELREAPATTRVPVLMLTANSLLDVINDALDAGADSYLLKPFAPAVLRRRVAQLLEGEAPTAT